MLFVIFGKISITCFPKLLPKSKGSTWVKRSDGDSGKIFCPVGGEHAAAELGVGVGGVGGEGGLGGQLSILLHFAVVGELPCLTFVLIYAHSTFLCFIAPQGALYASVLVQIQQQ